MMQERGLVIRIAALARPVEGTDDAHKDLDRVPELDPTATIRIGRLEQNV